MALQTVERWLARCAEADERWGVALYNLEQRSAPAAAASFLASLSVDEAVTFPLAALLCILAAYSAGLPRAALPGCCELFGDIAMTCAVEMPLKIVFRRRRPAYAQQPTFFCLFGEWWSMPSGHTLRAAFVANSIPRYCSTVLCPTTGACLVRGCEMAAMRVVAPLWTVAVGLSRVAHGRHYPFDCVAGAAVGTALAVACELGGPVAWAEFKYVCGSTLFLAAVAMLCAPSARKAVRGYPVHLVILVAWIASLPYGSGPIAAAHSSTSAGHGLGGLSSSVISTAGSPAKPPLGL
eukprot:TRINITY_DN60533_c0_g1_i1.p1 TRINITY_DN60533_c0_g1~~TRINITY_DN60533_c0_g1_i1.p1  ORF type:complete len:316 (+),score=82.80 TRINITY_DN60533_c0_g1_i1:69-950(+)